MANVIIPKRSTVAGKVPATGDLVTGEIAINLTDKKIYTKDGSGNVVAIGGSGGSGDVVGPTSSIDNAIVRYDGTTGKLVQNSAIYIDDSGNLGLGVTPNTWSGGYKAIQISDQGESIYSNYNYSKMGLVSNGYYGASGWTAIQSDQSALYDLESGIHTWFVSLASTTAGQPISFTETMRINWNGKVGIWNSNPAFELDITGTTRTSSSMRAPIFYDSDNTAYYLDAASTGTSLVTAGNVGIGTSSPAVKLDVVGQGRVVYNTGATNTGDQSVVTVGATTSGAYASSYGAGLQFQVTNSGGGYAGSRIVSRLGADNNTANLVFQARNYGYADSMTLDSSGNLGIGTSSPTTILQGTYSSSCTGLAIAGSIPTLALYDSSGTTGTGYLAQFDTTTVLYNKEAGPLTFGTSNTERMRIDSAGNVGIGTTTPTSKLDVNGDITVADKIIHGGDTNTAIRFPAADTFTVETNGSERFRVTANGNILTGTTIDFTSTTTPGGIATTGLGIYPYPVYSSPGAIANNTTFYSGLVQTFSFSGTNGASTQLSFGLVSAPILNNSGAGGTSQTGLDGIRCAPVIDSTGPNARIYSRGGLFQAIRASSNDTSAHVGNFMYGIQASVSHATVAPNTIYTNQLYGVIGTASNQSGNVGTLSGCVTSVFAGQQAGANTNSTTEASAFKSTFFNVGAASGAVSTVTNGYGVNLVGPTVGATGTMTNYYAFYAGTPTVTGNGTLTNRYGIWIDDSLSTNYFAGNVGIGTTSPSAKLHIVGNINLDGISVRDTATTTTTATTQVALATFAGATYDSAEIIIKAKQSTAVHITKLLVVYDGTTASATEFGTILTGSSLFTTDVDVSSGSVRVLITPASATSTVFKASYELITA